jgi:hypothetical protein
MDEISVVHNMAYLRVIGAAIEIIAALLMIWRGSIASALKINALLGLVGPAVLLAVSALGLVGIAVHVSPLKTTMVGLGVILILLGAR